METLTADTALVESYLWIPGALLYLPVGILAAVVVLELIDAFQKTRENDRAVLALLVLGLVTALIATHLGATMGFLLGDWGNFPFHRLFLGYLLGFGLLVTWAFKLLARRSWRRSAQLAITHPMTKHRTSGSRFLSSVYGVFLIASLALVAASVSYKADFGGVPAFVTLGVPGKVEDLPKPPPSSPPAAVAAVTPPTTTPATTPAPGADDSAMGASADPEPDSPADNMPAGDDPAMAAAADSPPEPENKEPQPQPLPEPKAATTIAAPADANLTVDFASQVLPILKENCFECHGESKDRGDLRVHTAEDIRKGGENGDVIVAGKPEDSSLYFLTTLDPKDEDIMPSKGDPLTKEQTEVLRTWILEGPYLADGKRIDDESGAAMAGEGDGDGGAMEEDDDMPLSTSIVIPNEEYLQTMKDEGIVVTQVADDDFMLEIDYSKAGKGPGEIDLKVLYPLARNIVSLDLSKTKVTDDDLEPLREFKNIVHLRLDRCNIGDSTMYHLSDLEKLETLNLFATRVGDSGINSLDRLENIKELVIVNTLVTPQGAARLQKSLPNAEIQAPE